MAIAQSGSYFVTICTYDRQLLFGDVTNGEANLNEFGQIVESAWFDLINHYPHVELDEFIVMPNHVHGIVVLPESVDAGLKPAPTTKQIKHGLPEIVRGLKTFSSRRINSMRGAPGTPVWQRGYYDHIIRNENDLAQIRHYTKYNALKWADDRYNPANQTIKKYRFNPLTTMTEKDNMPDTPLHYKTITELADLIKTKQVSPVEVTNHMLERIGELDGTLKSYATLMADSAIASARKAESEISAGNYRGHLHGVPIAVKDLCFTNGVRTMGGTKSLADHVPSFDSTVVARFEEAGAIMLGKLNLTEGAMGGYNPAFDIPKR